MYKRFMMTTTMFILLVALLSVTNLEEKSTANRWLKLGNETYEEGSYEGALIAYEEGLASLTGNKELLTNAGLTAMAMEDYDKAIQYLSQVTDQNLLLGNAYYYSALDQESSEGKTTMYLKALEAYKMGMDNKPEDVELKFNYEWVLEEMEGEERVGEEEREEEREGEGEREGEEEGEGGEGEEREGEQGEGEEQEEGGEQGEEREGEQGEEREGEGEQGEVRKEEGELEGEDEQVGLGGGAFEDGTEMGQEALEQILRLLEAQEEDSLKNNQGVRVDRGGDGNDW